MKQLKKEILSVARDLKKLTQKTEKMAKEVDRIGETQAAKESKPRIQTDRKSVGRTERKGKPADIIFSVIEGSKEGIDIATLKKKSGFQGWKLNDNLLRLKRQGKIKSVAKGVYVKG